MAENIPENMSLPERLHAAYTRGWDEAEEVVRSQMSDLLERSGRERAELEKKLRNVEIERDTWKKWCQQAERVVSRLEENQLKGGASG